MSYVIIYAFLFLHYGLFSDSVFWGGNAPDVYIHVYMFVISNFYSKYCLKIQWLINFLKKV